jgi:hypothetical protein
MDDNIAQNVTAERVKRVVTGYTNAKGQAVEGLGGGSSSAACPTNRCSPPTARFAPT